MASDKLTIYTDGGSRGNPGPAAAGYIITDSTGRRVAAKGVFLGVATNNEAEYTGIIESIRHAKKLGAKSIELFTDSELLARQLTGQYKVKSPKLRPLYEEAMELFNSFIEHSVNHVRREQNKGADYLVNQALDRGKDVVPSSSAKSRAATRPIRLGVLISGGGTTMVNLLDEIKQGRLNAEIPLVISSRSKVSGVDKARNAGLPTVIIRKKDCDDIDQFSEKIRQELKKAHVDLVVQAGWLCLWKIPDELANKVMNIHPALLPSFGGKGMFGRHVHEAVLKRGCKVSGCTVHFVNNEYDSGPIIVQRCCDVAEDDTADSLAGRVFQQECIAYPEAIRLFQQGRLAVKDGVVKIKSQ